jgi:hypothetical protein
MLLKITSTLEGRFASWSSGFIGALVLSVVATTTAYADELNPRTREDCDRPYKSRWEEFLTVSKQSHQCFQEEIFSRARQPSERPIDICSNGISTERNFPACAQITQAKCQKKIERRSKFQTCLANLERYRDWKKARNAEQREVERLAREEERLQREQARNDRLAAQRTQRLNAQGRELYEQIGSGSQDVVRGSQVAGIGIGIARNRVPPLGSSFPLSALMTEVGGQVLGHMWRDAIGQLDNALGEFNASNPRPTEGQRTAYYNDRGELLYTFVTANTRAQAQEHYMPLKGQSAVVGSYAGAIGQIVQMRNSGEIDQPIAALGTVLATVVAARAYKEAKERAKRRTSSAVPTVNSSEQLRERRQAVLTPLRKERVRLAPKRQPVKSKPKAQSVWGPRPNCFRPIVSYTRQGVALNTFFNGCSRTVFCRVSVTHGGQTGNKSITLGPGRQSGSGYESIRVKECRTYNF